MFCKFLSDTSYSVAVRAAAARLLLSCHSAWTVSLSSMHLCRLLFLLSALNLFHPFQTVLSFSFCLPFLQPPYPHAFEETIVDNIKKWVTEDPEASNECEWKYLGKNKPTDAEMLRTYAIGLLAMALCRYC